jgi:hypothetical protein
MRVVAFSVLMVATLAQPALCADLDYGPYGPRPYPVYPPSYDDGGAAYPSHRYRPARQDPYGQYRYTYQSPPYDYGVPAYPPPRYMSPPHDICREGPYEYEGHEFPAPAHPPHDSMPYGYDYGPRGNGPGYYRYPDRYEYRRGPAAAELEPPRPPVPVMGSRRGAWIAHPPEISDDTAFEAIPPSYPWSASVPRR